MLDKEELLKYKSEILGIKRVCLGDIRIEPNVLLIIPEELARKHVLIPIAMKEDKLVVAMADPTNRQAVEDITFYSGYQVERLLASEDEIKIAIREHYTLRKSNIQTAPERATSISIWKVDEEREYGYEAPVITLVDSLLHQAVNERASDIHWEPRENELIVKFRIDGLLEIKANLPLGMARSIASRIKIMAGMDVTERRKPQDGSFVLDLMNKRVDIRVSTFATVYGEKVVTRILDQETAKRSLTELGMRPELESDIRRLLKQTHGLILVAGPTGSGKTTTLYALLRELQSEYLNIVSIEDPVEYRLSGVNQAQVNPKIGLDFAGGLRAILRQDPDIIMVGEIRDKETARIACTAALTGHLVLSTVHTNTAVEALIRMLDMDVEPYLLAASISGVLAQRLVRKLCPHCKSLREVTTEESKIFNLAPTNKVYSPKGCAKCRGTGYMDRIGIHEYLPYNRKIKELILQKKSSVNLENACQQMGVIDLKKDALLKVAAGLTSLEEVMRLSIGV